MDHDRASAQAQAIAEAVGRLGEPISEAQAREIATRQECECQDGMFALAPTRRGLLGSAGLVAAVGATAMLPHPTFAKAPPGAAEYQVPEDPTKEPGRLMGVDGGYGSRSQFETDVRWVNPTRTASFTPLQASYGTITPSGLHYERHHAGIPNIDPARHRLIIHGMVDRPIKYSLADLKRFPTVSRTYFLECSGTTGSEIMKAREPTVQRTHGLVSTSEWTGVPLSTLLKQTGLKSGAAWVLAEGSDAAVMTRSVPIDKCLSDALVVFAQNGEAIRPEQGYPMRLFLPGWEGNISIKWLRRLEVSDKPFYTREETSKYTDLITTTGKARIYFHYGSEIGDHLSVGRDEPARTRVLQDHRSCLVRPRKNCPGRDLDRRRQDLEPRGAAGSGFAHLSDPLPLPVDLGWDASRHPEPRDRRDWLYPAYTPATYR
jgi:sulfane dehydrogenase subunit SoxC